jgi:hypothetical protein
LKVVSSTPARVPPTPSAYARALALALPRDAAALAVLAADQVARALRCDQDHVEVLARLDLLEVDVEAVREQQGGARREVRQDLLVVLGLRRVGREQRHQRGALDGLGRGGDFQAVLLRLLPAVALADADHHVVAGVLQVQRVRATLAAIADDRDPGAFQGLLVHVLLRVRTHVSHSSIRSTMMKHGCEKPRPARVRCGVSGLWSASCAFSPGPRTSAG